MRHSYKDQFLIEFKSLISGYPDFVYSRNSQSVLNGIPVFVFHSIDSELFESQLQYLKNNGYRTLSIHEFYELIVNPKAFENNRNILLTIDDARSSVWRYAYPLLKKYQMRATVFIIPGITAESNSCKKNLEDYWNNKCSLKVIHEEDVNDDTICNWCEIKEMYSSGFVDIESHTLFHREIFCNLKINDFITADTPFVPYNFRGSPYYSIYNLEKPFLKKDFLGLPLFESAPLMLAGQKLNIFPEFITKCKEVYSNFSKNNETWKNEIKRIVEEQASESEYFSFESNSKDDVLQDLNTARKIIQERLGTKAGNHLCLPWTRGNEETINICEELGIKSCFWGILPGKKINKPGDDPYYISRIKNDFIFRLPGEGRKNLLAIYSYKIKRRLSGDKIF